MSVGASPRIFRVLLPAHDLARAVRFYETLLGTAGRPVADGRVYFDCGSVILGVLDYSSSSRETLPGRTEAIYFAVRDLDQIHARAKKLGCLSPELLHGDPEGPMGEIRVRPWGERSFYVDDPSGNSVCFVDEETLFTGTPEQIRKLSEP